MIEVRLIAKTNEVPVNVVERAACVCYNSEPDYEEHRHAHMCARRGHWSVWEHINFTFHVRGVSRALLAQLSRHRHISLSVRSQRYCNETAFDYVKLDSCDGHAAYAYADAMGEAAAKYRALTALGVPKEDARMVLPNACCTELIMTANARALIEISHQRLCSRAQWEIRELFEKIRDLMREYSPDVAIYMVPKCMAHSVPFCEEAKSCGLSPRLDEDWEKGQAK